MIEKISSWFTNVEHDKTDHNVDISIDILSLQKTIKYDFKNRDLLVQALSHRSFYVESSKQLFSNERLEFLGDAVIDLVVTEFLYKQFPKENEGLLSQKKAILVSRKVLGKICEEMELGEFLILNKGEEKTGGRKRLSNLANLFEALLGAIYLDGGLKAAKSFIEDFLLNRQKELLNTRTFFNYKSILLEFAQSRGWGTPEYFVMEESGPDHHKTFLVKVKVNNKWALEGKGPNKKSAEQNAAKNTLKIMSETHPELTINFTL